MPIYLRWRVSKLIFARAENKLFLVWRSEEPDGCQLLYKLMGLKGAGLNLCPSSSAKRESKSADVRCTMLAKLNTYTDLYFQQVLIIDG